MKERGVDRLKCAINESTLSTADAVPLPQCGRLRYEDAAFLDTTPFPRGEGKEEAASPPKKEANPASLRSAAPSKGRGSRGHSLLPMEGGAPKGRRLDGGRGMKKGRSSQVDDSQKHPLQKQLIKPIYSYKKRKSNAANDFNVIYRFGYRYMRKKSEAVHFYD